MNTTLKVCIAGVSGLVVGAIGGFFVSSKLFVKHAANVVEEEWNKHLAEEEARLEKIEDEMAAKQTLYAEAREAFKAYQGGQNEESEAVEGEKTEVEEKEKEVNGPDLGSPFRAGEPRIVPESYYIEHPDNREDVEYYTGDDIFVNEDGNPIEEPYKLFGRDILDYFGTTSDDPDLVHVYNETEDVYYEIARIVGFFDPK